MKTDDLPQGGQSNNGTNEDLKDRCEHLIAKAEVGKELQVSLVLSLEKPACLPLLKGEVFLSFFFLVERIICCRLN